MNEHPNEAASLGGHQSAAESSGVDAVSAPEVSTPSTADVLSGWAAEADDAMRGPLLELAAHAEAEIERAKVATERAILAVVAEAFEPAVEPEAFAILAAVRQIRERAARADKAEEFLWLVARLLGVAPEDHGHLSTEAIRQAILRGVAAAQKLNAIRATLGQP